MPLKDVTPFWEAPFNFPVSILASFDGVAAEAIMIAAATRGSL
jgi:hypothetical protein